MFTLFSLVTTLALYFYSGEPKIEAGLTTTLIISLGVALLFITILVLAISYIPLQKAEENITPSLFNLYRKDNIIFTILLVIAAFTFLSVLVAFNFTFFNFIKPQLGLSLWIVGFGIALDCLVWLLRRTANFLNPFTVINMFSNSAKKSIQDNKEVELCDSIDALTEIGTKAVNRMNMAVCIESISELKHLSKVFLESSKTLGHEEENPELKQIGVRDKVSFILFYILQRLEMIFDHALAKKLEPICSFIITALGKITLFAAQYDITMTSYPLHFLNKLALRALECNLPEVGVKTTLAILEIAKGITSEANIAYMELQPPFLTMINILDAIAKETFKRDKKTNIRILMQPFLDLKELFKSEKMATHQDTPIILLNIDRVISEYETLETVLKTMPPLPTLVPEGSSS